MNETNLQSLCMLFFYPSLNCLIKVTPLLFLFQFFLGGSLLLGPPPPISYFTSSTPSLLIGKWAKMCLLLDPHIIFCPISSLFPRYLHPPAPFYLAIESRPPTGVKKLTVDSRAFCLSA